jgi:hypothetical protein
VLLLLPYARLERLAGLDEDRRFTGSGLVAPKDQVAIERIELYAAADALGLILRLRGRAGAEEIGF